MTTKSTVNPQQGAFAHHVMRVLGHDMSFSAQDGNERTLEGVLDKYAVRDPNTKAINWGATADSLINSLNHIITDDVAVTKGANGQDKVEVVKERSLSVENAAQIKAWFQDIGEHEKTAKGMAEQLVKANFSPDKSKKESMFEFLLRAGQDAGGMEYQTNGDMMGMLHGLLSAFDPKLADAFMGLVKGVGAVAETEGQANTRDSLENAWQFVMGGDEKDLATLWGQPLKDQNGKSIDYNNFRGPQNDVGVVKNGELTPSEQFFDGTWRRGYDFDLGQGVPVFETNSFKDMVFDAWVDQGVIKITDKSLDGQGNSVVEGQAIQLAKQLMLGGKIGTEFVDRLVDNGVVKFDGMSEAEIDSFKTDLTAHLGKMDMSGDGSSLLAANEIVYFVKDREAVNPGESGVHFRGVDHENDRVRYGDKNPLNVYTAVRDRMEDMLDPYSKATDPRDFAERFAHHANKIPGLHVGFESAAPEKTSQLIDRSTYKAQAPDEPDSDQARVKFEAQSTEHLGRPSVDNTGDQGYMLISKQPAPAYFNHCASGANAVQCAFDSTVEAKNDARFDDVDNSNSYVGPQVA